MFRIVTNKTWSRRYCTGHIVFVIVHSCEKKNFKKFQTFSKKNGFPLNYINRQIHHFLAKKQSKKPKTDKKENTKRIFMKLPYIKEMNGHIPKEINGFLKKLDFKVTFILINETFNLKRLFTFKERQNKLHRSSVVYRITCSCKSTYIGQTSRNLITRLKNHDPNSLHRQDTDVSKHLTDNPRNNGPNQSLAKIIDHRNITNSKTQSHLKC